tara:strand:- start:367 stop:744 length:378 start_codon:yes stop_codon:yes gene_type:complete
MEIARGSREHQAIAQVLMESLYLLDSHDTSGIRCFNKEEFLKGTWGRFACIDTAMEVVDELFEEVYNDHTYYGSVPDYQECYQASKRDPRGNALSAVVEVDNEYLDDLCTHLGYYLEEEEEVEND